MFNFLLAFVVSTLAVVPLHLAYGLQLLYCGLISMVLFALLYFWLSRRTMKQVVALMESAQRDLQANRPEKAIATLHQAFRYAPWQFYVKGQVNAQIGTVYYLRREFAKAMPYLEKAFVRHWVAMCMLAVSYMKRNKPAKMRETFDKAAAANRKEPFIWNLYAYCLQQVGDKAKAREILEKGIKKVGGDERLDDSIKALEQDRRMKMQEYGDIWYQFHLEKPGALIKKQTKALQGRRKMPRV